MKRITEENAASKDRWRDETLGKTPCGIKQRLRLRLRVGFSDFLIKKMIATKDTKSTKEVFAR